MKTFIEDLRSIASENWMTIGGKPFAIEAAIRLDQLHAALLTARDTIKALHGPIAWDIYDQNAPEMKQINAALEKAKT